MKHVLGQETDMFYAGMIFLGFGQNRLRNAQKKLAVLRRRKFCSYADGLGCVFIFLKIGKIKI